MQDIIYEDGIITIGRRRKRYSITTTSIKKDISKFPFDSTMPRDRWGRSYKVPKVEEARYPALINILHYFIIEHDRIPSPTEFIDMVIAEYFDVIDKDSVIVKDAYVDRFIVPTRLPLDPLKCRILRTYVSICREFYFFLQCAELDGFHNVRYSTICDYFKGIDLIITHHSHRYGICLKMKTSQSASYSLKKLQHRHKDIYSGNLADTIIELYMPVFTFPKYGDFFLPDSSYMYSLYLDIILGG